MTDLDITILPFFLNQLKSRPCKMVYRHEKEGSDTGYIVPEGKIRLLINGNIYHVTGTVTFVSIVEGPNADHRFLIMRLSSSAGTSQYPLFNTQNSAQQSRAREYWLFEDWYLSMTGNTNNRMSWLAYEWDIEQLREIPPPKDLKKGFWKNIL